MLCVGSARSLSSALYYDLYSSIRNDMLENKPIENWKDFNESIEGFYNEMRENATVKEAKKEKEIKMKELFWLVAAVCLLGTWIVGSVVAVIWLIAKAFS